MLHLSLRAVAVLPDPSNTNTAAAAAATPYSLANAAPVNVCLPMH